MRIQTRLFLGTAALVLALMATQWWLYARQLRAIETEVTRVATTVGSRVLTAERAIFGDVLLHGARDMFVDVESRLETLESRDVDAATEDGPDVQVVVVGDASEPHVAERTGQRVIRREFVRNDDEPVVEKFEWVVETRGLDEGDAEVMREHLHEFIDEESLPEHVRKLQVAVEGGDERHERFLVVSEGDEAVHRIPIPVSPAVEQVRETMREGAAVGGLLLFVGLFASAILSRRLTSPLRSLAHGAEALGQGELGIQVSESAGGEVGDLQRAFNLMSARLAELEAERERWQEREHLAQLGDLSRGLAHTLRNPLHTLGLAVEELASDSGDRDDLVATSRSQIRRIDRWLRSFLALGAEEAAEPEVTNLGDLIRAVALESVQQGVEVLVEGGEDELLVRVVPGAVRAALANIVENAIEVSPAGEPVKIDIVVEGGDARVSIVDGGPGLPDAVREKLFSPHVTTKVGGSGMGLFLARQLVVGMHGGGLEIADGDDRGTVATMRLPLVDKDPIRGGADVG
jgi:signal transduction histidine kinase